MIELARCGKIVHNVGTQMDSLGNYNKEETLVIILSINGMFLNEVSRKTSFIRIKQELADHADKSWLITMNKTMKNNLTDNSIIINCDNPAFEFSLNTAIAFFELAGECYQEMFG